MTSATGISEARRLDAGFTRAARLPGSAGFTLVELVVAIVIIGIAAAAIVLTLPGNGDAVRASAVRLAAHASAARDAAILSGRPLLFTPDAQGWQAGTAPPVRLPAGQSLNAEPAGPVLFDPTGLASPARLTVRQGDATASVTISAAGAIDAR